VHFVTERCISQLLDHVLLVLGRLFPQGIVQVVFVQIQAFHDLMRGVGTAEDSHPQQHPRFDDHRQRPDAGELIPQLTQGLPQFGF
jgi:hypothetical protein